MHHAVRLLPEQRDFAECGRRTAQPDALARLFLSLRKEGAYNINLVSPTPYTPYILDALGICAGELEIPVVWNTGGYETPETVRAAARMWESGLPT